MPPINHYHFRETFLPCSLTNIVRRIQRHRVVTSEEAPTHRLLHYSVFIFKHLHTFRWFLYLQCKLRENAFDWDLPITNGMSE